MLNKIQSICEDLNIKFTNRLINSVNSKIEIINNIIKNQGKLNLIIYGEPKVSKRPRKGKHGFFAPDSKDKNEIITSIKNQLPENFNIIRTALKIKMEVYIEPIKGFSGVDKVLCEMGKIYPCVRPDVDNIAKIYMDAMNNLVYLDDGQVYELNIIKKYASNPRVEIQIEYDRDDRSSKLKK